jgi:hypothetical protein
MSVNAACPVCTYPLDVELREVRMRSRTFCPNCKTPIQLEDERASTDRTLGNAKRAIDGLERTLRRIGS